MTFRLVTHLGVLVSVVGGLVVACSSAPSVTDYCGKLKARYDACPNGTGGSSSVPAPAPPDGGTSTPPPRSPFNQARCETNHRCLTTLYESSIGSAYLDCAGATDCTVSTSKCGESALAKGSHATEADVCAKKYAECKGGGKKSFDDDYCPSIRGVTSELLSKLMPCFEKPCDQISSCLGASVEAFAPGCEID